METEYRQPAKGKDMTEPHTVTGPSDTSTETARHTAIAKIQYTRSQVIPVARDILRQHRVIAGYQPSPFVDAYKVLRTKVLQRMRERGWNSIAVTSPTPDAGTTLTAINLAISMAAELDQTVLLVDANLRRPSVHRFFGFEPALGLNDYLLDGTGLDQMLVHPEGIDRLVILPGTRPLLESSEMLASPQMIRLVSEMKTRYPSRIVVFDLPPCTTADTLAFVPYVDTVLLVLEEGRTTQDEVQHAIAHFQSTSLLGTVLNKAEIPLPKALVRSSERAEKKSRGTPPPATSQRPAA